MESGMLARFFIDRPIFATVVSVVITLCGGIAMVALPIAQYPQITPPSVSLSISYPGANAQVVQDTIAAPIEQAVNGVQGMLYMSSTSGSDGSYSLSITFEVGTNLNTALVMVQNRVALALPLLPTEVQAQGITVRKKSPDQLMIISFYSSDENYIDRDLSNFALINLKDELLRVPGVSDVSIMGERDYAIRIWLDPRKLASRGMTAMDVASAVRSQSIQAAAGQTGQPPASVRQTSQLPIDMLGRLSTPEQFGDIIVKVGAPATGTAAASADSAAGGSDTGLAQLDHCRARSKASRRRAPPPAARRRAAVRQQARHRAAASRAAAERPAAAAAPAAAAPTAPAGRPGFASRVRRRAARPTACRSDTVTTGRQRRDQRGAGRRQRADHERRCRSTVRRGRPRASFGSATSPTSNSGPPTTASIPPMTSTRPSASTSSSSPAPTRSMSPRRCGGGSRSWSPAFRPG